MLKGLRVVKKKVTSPTKGKSTSSTSIVDVSSSSLSSSTTTTTQPPESSAQRDSWMTDPSLRRQKAIKETSAKPSEEKTQRDNSHLYECVKVSDREADNRKQIGDGGRSWRRKIQQRRNEKYRENTPKESHPRKTTTREQESKEESNTNRSSFLYQSRQDNDETQHQFNVKDAVHSHTHSTHEFSNVNKLSSLALKAKLRGDTTSYANLQKQIAAIQCESSPARVEIISSLDAKGRSKTLMHKQEMLHENIQKRVQTDLRIEKLRTRDEYSMESAMSMVRDKHFVDGNTDDQFDMASNALFEDKKKKRKLGSLNEAEIKRKQEISEHKHIRKVIDRCWYCFDGPSLLRHTIVSVGLQAYLSIPQCVPLSSGHCLIVPCSHTNASTSLDEDVYEEICYFKQHLVRMFAAKRKHCVFIEMSGRRKNQHCFIECIPVDSEQYHEAPMFFQKAISETDEEWSQHPKLIDTTKKGLRKSVPNGFPYFHVEIGLKGPSYAHLIEDESKFPVHFGKEVLCGILQEPAEIMLRAKPQSRSQIRERVESIKKDWSLFDWTQKLHHKRASM